jgi:sulfate permease, SulP family
LSGVFDLEYTALKALNEAEKRLSKAGISVWLVGLTPAVLRVVERSSLSQRLGRDQMHFNLEIAVRKYHDGLTPDAGGAAGHPPNAIVAQTSNTPAESVITPVRHG